MALVRDTVCLKTGKMLHREIIDENSKPDIMPLVYDLVYKLIEMEKREEAEQK